MAACGCVKNGNGRAATCHPASPCLKNLRTWYRFISYIILSRLRKATGRLRPVLRSEKMLLLVAVLAVLSAAFMLFRLTKRRDPEFQNTIPIEPPPNARPLFEPTADELRRDAAEGSARLIARREHHARARKRAAIDVAVSNWRAIRDGKTAAELLRVTAETGLDGDFSRAATEIIRTFDATGIVGLAGENLAALLDSHIRLLSDSERGSGGVFWLKQEVARLRADSEVAR